MQEWLNHIKRQCLTYQSGSFWQHGIKRFSVLPKLRSAVLERILFWFNIPLFYFANQNLLNISVILFMERYILENRILTIALVFCLKAPGNFLLTNFTSNNLQKMVSWLTRFFFLANMKIYYNSEIFETKNKIISRYYLESCNYRK